MTLNSQSNNYSALLASAKAIDTSVVDLRKTLRLIGNLIDCSNKEGQEEGLQFAIEISKAVRSRVINNSYEASFCYNLGNAHSGLRQLLLRKNADKLSFQIPEAEKELLEFRRADMLIRDEENNRFLKCQVLTNLGNVLSFLGRPVEAVSKFDHALDLDESFAEAQGNRGIALFCYGLALPDPGHCSFVLIKAHQDLKKALLGQLEKGAIHLFQDHLIKIERLFEDKKSLDYHLIFQDYSLGDSNEERQYRNWCLQHCFFLNPLNDLGPYTIGARDVLLLPPMAGPIGDGPYFQEMFNLLKQEYATLRFFLYCGSRQGEPHFSDREVRLINPMTYPSYGLNVECLRQSFRMAYSVLDKIGFFLNKYFELGMNVKKIYFHNLWYKGKTNNGVLKQVFEKKENWPLRGLFWLSKDLYCEEHDSAEPLEPSSRQIADIRHHLEHKFLSIHDSLIGYPDKEEEGLHLYDPDIYHIARSNFEKSALLLTRLVRSALIYLTLAVKTKEHANSKNRKSIPHVPLDTYEDSWKR